MIMPDESFGADERAPARFSAAPPLKSLPPVPSRIACYGRDFEDRFRRAALFLLLSWDRGSETRPGLSFARAFTTAVRVQRLTRQARKATPLTAPDVPNISELMVLYAKALRDS